MTEPATTGRASRSVEEENKATLRRLLNEIWGKGNANAVDDLYAAHFVDHTPYPGTTPNREGIKQSLQFYRKAFPDSQFTIDDLVADGDRVAGRFTYSGTHKGELMGIPPTGKHVKIEGLALSRLEDGKIVESWEIPDQQKLMEQLGVSQGPGQSKR